MLIKMCPSQKEDILVMAPQDLKDKLSVLDANTAPKQKSIERERKQAKILSVCPGMESELRFLGDADLEEIYQQFFSS